MKLGFKMRTVIFISLVIIASNVMAKEIYKWENPQGRIIYSDEKPEGEWFDIVKEGEMPSLTTLPEPQKIEYYKAPKRKIIRKKQKYDPCPKYEKQLEYYTNRLRSGYTAAEGGKLRKRKRELQALVSDECW